MESLLFSWGTFLATAMTVATVLIGLFAVARWIRRGFWVPRYVHGMALAAFIVGVWVGYQVLVYGSPKAEGEFETTLVAILVSLLLPAMVYFFFAFYGGVDAAHGRKPIARDDEPIDP